MKRVLGAAIAMITVAGIAFAFGGTDLEERLDPKLEKKAKVVCEELAGALASVHGQVLIVNVIEKRAAAGFLEKHQRWILVNFRDYLRGCLLNRRVSVSVGGDAYDSKHKSMKADEDKFRYLVRTAKNQGLLPNPDNTGAVVFVDVYGKEKGGRWWFKFSVLAGDTGRWRLVSIIPFRLMLWSYAGLLWRAIVLVVAGAAFAGAVYNWGWAKEVLPWALAACAWGFLFYILFFLI